MRPSAGKHISDKVELVRPLGVGGMGSVWVARHRGLDTEVAVKFIAKADVNERQLERFKREAKLAAKLKNPHVVRMFDYGVTDDDTPYIVMELLEGESLAERISGSGPLSLRETQLLVSQVSVALSEAHGLAIVHRDIKPANIFLVDSGYKLFVKLLDFGVAKQRGRELMDVTSTGTVMGTPHYMSPEQMLNTKDVDHRADLWALAVVAYQAMTGRLPFSGKTVAALSMRISEGGFTPPSSLVNDAGSELDIWFKLALCRNINGRYTSAEELSSTLAAAIEGKDGDRDSLVVQSVRSEEIVSSAGSTDAPAASQNDTDDDAPTETSERDEIRPALSRGPSTVEHPTARHDRTMLWTLLLFAVLLAVVLVRNWGWWRVPDTDVIAPSRATASNVTEAPSTPTSIPTGSVSAVVTERVEPAPSASDPTRAREPATKTTTKPDCREPFIVDANGDIHPRPECLR